MQKLFYAGGYLFMSDSSCAAVMDYAKALADTGTSDLVTVPSLSDEGVRGQTQLLIGPTSQLFATPARDRGVDLEDVETVTAMRDKVVQLQPARGRTNHGDDLEDGLDGDY